MFVTGTVHTVMLYMSYNFTPGGLNLLAKIHCRCSSQPYLLVFGHVFKLSHLEHVTGHTEEADGGGGEEGGRDATQLQRVLFYP